MGSEPCAAEVKVATEFTLGGRAVTLIDIPGFDRISENDAEISKIVAAFLATT